MSPIRVVLVDDHVLVRDTLKLLLHQDPQIKVVGVAGSGNEAFDVILREKPDVALTDIDMPGRTCFDVADALARLVEGTVVVLLSGHSHDYYIQMARQAKVGGYVTKDERPEAVIEAIKLAAAGKRYFSPSIRARMEADGRAPLLFDSAVKLDLLSLREKEVLVQLARGMSVKEVAAALSISRKTVDNHAQRLMAKLDIHSRSELVRFAIREKLVQA